jgi:Putative Actinobacterial Holin-X, holin superfamily III
MDFSSSQTTPLGRLGANTAERLSRVAYLEARLIQAEFSENRRKLEIGAVAIAAAIVFAVVFVGAFFAWLALLMIESGYAASDAVGILTFFLFVVSAGAALAGYRLIRKTSFVPRRSIAALKDVLRTLRAANV